MKLHLETLSNPIAGDVLASITTMQWNGTAMGWNAGLLMDDANVNRRQTIRVGAGVAFAQVGIMGFDGQIELEALRLFGSGRQEFAAEVSWDLPSLALGATSLLDAAVRRVNGADFGLDAIRTRYSATMTALSREQAVSPSSA